MKVKIFFLITAMLSAAFAKGQMTYAGISMAYGAGWPAYSLGSSVTTSPSGTKTYTLKKGSFGQGLHFGITTGYMFSKNAGIDLGVSYLIGSKKEFNTSVITVDTSTATSTDSEGTVNFDKIKMIQLNPALKVTMGEEVRPYVRLGIILGLSTSYSKIEQGTTIISGNISDTTSTEIVTEYSGSAAFGFNYAAGVDIDLVDNLVLFGELTFRSMSWAPSKSKITRYFVNGIDLAPTAPPGSLETEYVDDYSQSVSGSSNRALKTYLPFSSLGFSAGVVFTFGE